ncbi:ABC-F family ATP-binding cassette domain-containing protein, partial [bacterium]|nr:ABC-F family ATP-binding cassette domain-containing protein [bacterium]
MQSKIHFSNVEFQYENMSYPLFQELSFEWDLIWKLALVGKNGCGKSTLVRLIERRLIPGSGKIQQPGSVSFLPVYKDIDSQKGLVSEVVEQVVAPFSKWVHELEHFSQCEDLDGIQSCLDLLESHGWHDFETRMEQVFSQMQLDHSLLRREFSSLSGGEKTRVMLAALFLKPNSYVILDEPTHHLDEWARGAVARFLQRQKGFLLISHDRYFLNQCVDHVAHLQNGSVELYRSGFEEFEDALWKHKVFI